MKQILGIVLMCVPIIFLIMAWHEGRIIGLAIYVLYVIATLCSIGAPIFGYRLIRR